MTAETKVTLGTTRSPSEPQELKLPHERDESVQQGEVKVDAHAKKAAKDASKGMPDTSRAVEANIAYQRQKQP
jgi:hypothetical protein